MNKRTIGRRIEHNEARVNLGRVFSTLVLHRICVPAQSICGLVEIDVVRRSIERPQRSYARDATSDDGYFLPPILRRARLAFSM